MEFTRASLACLLVVLIASSSATGVLITNSGEERMSTVNDRPDEVYQRVTVDLDQHKYNGDFEIQIAYPAESSSEATAAEEGELEVPDWYDGEDRIELVFNRSSRPDESLETTTSIDHRDSYLPDPKPLSVQDPEHGWIVISTDARWINYSRPGDDIELGEGFTREFGEEWHVHVKAPTDWEPTEMNGDPSTEPADRTDTLYKWYLEGNESMPLIAYDSPVVPRSADGSGDASFGVGGLIATVLLAIYLHVSDSL